MIRNATLEDIPKLVEMGLALHDESTYKHVEYSPERVAETCRLMIANGFLVVAEKEGEVIGVMMGDVYVPWYTTERMGIDYTLYIMPEHRNGLIAVKMIKRFEQWCISMGAKQIRPGIGTGDPSAIKLYKALGYRSVGEWFLKDVA
jgi:GNAT superfamily N-acetyltransferase